MEPISRRRLLGVGLAALPVPALLHFARVPLGTMAATPACGAAGKTHRQTEGPFFSTGSPERTSLLEAGVTGTHLTIAGVVLDTHCRPLSGVKLDFWQADSHGEYDNSGFRLRGHQFTDDAGRYTLETVVPGLYPGRTRHVHVKVQPKGGRVLTTQLYFPHEKRNRSDGIFDAALLMAVHRVRNVRAATFDFVLAT